MPLNSRETLMIDELRLHLRLRLRSELRVLVTDNEERGGRPEDCAEDENRWDPAAAGVHHNLSFAYHRGRAIFATGMPCADSNTI
jgi:hypothetical protein